MSRIFLSRSRSHCPSRCPPLLRKNSNYFPQPLILHRLSRTRTASSSSIRSFSSSTDSNQKQFPRSGQVLKFSILASAVGALAYNFTSESDEDRSWRLAVWKTLPLRLISRAWGEINGIELPVSFRGPLYRLWARVFSADLSECDRPLDEYRNLKEFFVRRLRPGVRIIDSTTELVSPCDAVVTAMGVVSEGGLIEQVKGMDYKVSEFLGDRPPLPSLPDSALHYIVFYLAPGDYHRIHCSADAVFSKRRHFPGSLFPVKPSIIEFIPNAFVRNERIVLSGRWKHGFFSLTPVGAMNVGSIRLNYDEAVVSNQRPQRAGIEDLVDPYGPNLGGFTRLYENPATGATGLKVSKGDEIARFELGSTVVLVFEASKNFRWTIKAGDRSKVGQKIAEFDGKK